MKTSTIRKLANMHSVNMIFPCAIPIIRSTTPIPIDLKSSHTISPKRPYHNLKYTKKVYYPEDKTGKNQKIRSISQPVSDSMRKFNILIRNSDILVSRREEKIASWEKRLQVFAMLLYFMQDKLEQDPTNKELAVLYKKSEKRYWNSCTDLFKFLSQPYHLTVFDVPSKPLLDGFECFSLPSDLKEKQTKRYHDKKNTIKRKKERKNKMKEREFFCKEWEANDSEFEISHPSHEEGFDTSNREVKNYDEVYENLLAAECALKSSCVEDAAWAIHEGTEEAHRVEIEKASYLLENYLKALEEYKTLTGVFD